MAEEEAEGNFLSLIWNNHMTNFQHLLSSLQEKSTLSDATLACEGKMFPVHKLVLSTCSDFFLQVFDCTPCKHPVIVLQDISPLHVHYLLSYMYGGQVSVAQHHLPALIKAAEALQIKGLSVNDDEEETASSNNKGQTVGRHSTDKVSAQDGDVSYGSSKRDVNTPPPSGDSIEEVEEIPHHKSTKKIKQHNEFQQNRLNNNISSSSNLSKFDDSTSPQIFYEEKCNDYATPIYNQVKQELPYDAGKEIAMDSDTFKNWNSPIKDDELKDIIPSQFINEEENTLNFISEHTNPLLSPHPSTSQPYSTSPFSPRGNSRPNTDPLAMPPNRICPMCPKGFQSRADVVRHMRTHTGERPYKCPHCPYSAALKGNLKSHMISRHSEVVNIGLQVQR